MSAISILRRRANDRFPIACADVPTAARRRALTLAFACIALAGCSSARPLMPTPTMYLDSPADPFAQVVPAYQSSVVDVLYATDRVPEPKQSTPDIVFYGSGRDPSLAYGSCGVTIGDNVSWTDLVRNSRVEKRDIKLPMTVTAIKELGRFPETPHVHPDDDAEEAKVGAEFLQEFSRRLALTPRKEAFIFIHGYHDTFDAAACTAAEMWHFMGREGVPIVYTWPAGHGGLIKGYEYDQESGEFTLYHLKRFIDLLVSCPELQSISIMAHSRGTVIAMEVVRELCVASRVMGKEARDAYKINNLILAAADIDVMVATQQLFAGCAGGANRRTIYVNDHDKALGLSGFLFADRRMGRLDYKDLTPLERTFISGATRTAIVDDDLKTKGIGHGYFHSVPEISSDLILVLRDNKNPGAENGRPMIELGKNYWEIKAHYPTEAPPAK